MRQSRPVATVSIDLDEAWAYRASFGLADDGTRLLPTALPRFAETMHGLGAAGTAFVVGRDASAISPQLRELVAAGHEIGNHSWQHDALLVQADAETALADLARAHAAIEEAAGVAPRGFRGPSFAVSAALLDAVSRLGYAYDSSVFPNALAPLARRWQARRSRSRGRGPAPVASHGAATPAWRTPLVPFEWLLPRGTRLLELPVTTLPLARVPMHGTYLQHLADRSEAAALAYAGAAFALCAARGVAPHLLLHGTDFVGADEAAGLHFLPGMRRPGAAKTRFVQQVLALLRRRFEPTTMAAFARRLQEPPLAALTARRPVPAR